MTVYSTSGSILSRAGGIAGTSACCCASPQSPCRETVCATDSVCGDSCLCISNTCQKKTGFLCASSPAQLNTNYRVWVFSSAFYGNFPDDIRPEWRFIPSVGFANWLLSVKSGSGFCKHPARDATGFMNASVVCRNDFGFYVVISLRLDTSGFWYIENRTDLGFFGVSPGTCRGGGIYLPNPVHFCTYTVVIPLLLDQTLVPVSTGPSTVSNFVKDDTFPPFTGPGRCFSGVDQNGVAYTNCLEPGDISVCAPLPLVRVERL